MNAKAKTIQLLLYDGTLSGVINIADSAWNPGEMYASPREAVNELVSLDKYGVYLLLSNERVYVGQAQDLERRIRQHLAGKDWWERVVLLTTQDDSFTRTDIDYLESVLIGKAEKAQSLDSDNKNKGNNPKVDKFRKVTLDQYLEEALFLMELIGVTVFSDSKKKGTLRRRKPTITITTPEESPSSESSDSDSIMCENPNETIKKPSLPSDDLKIGEYVYTALRNLGDSGFVFSDEQIDEMCTSEWTKQVFHTKYPFMKKYIPGSTDCKGSDGESRFIAKPFTFGDKQVLISKEWYERQRVFFNEWYMGLFDD